MERLVKEIVAFASVSGVAALVALVLFNLLVHGPGQVMHAHALTAYFVASSLGMVISFTGTRKYAFAHRETRGLGGGTVNYVVVNTLSLGIPMACLWVSRNLLGESGVVMDNVSANIVGSTLATVFRYFAFKQFVFRRPVTGLLARRTESSGVGGPEVGPAEAELVEHQPQQRHTDPDHVVGVSGHPADEG